MSSTLRYGQVDWSNHFNSDVPHVTSVSVILVQVLVTLCNLMLLSCSSRPVPMSCKRTMCKILASSRETSYKSTRQLCAQCERFQLLGPWLNCWRDALVCQVIWNVWEGLHHHLPQQHTMLRDSRILYFACARIFLSITLTRGVFSQETSTSAHGKPW